MNADRLTQTAVYMRLHLDEVHSALADALDDIAAKHSAGLNGWCHCTHRLPCPEVARWKPLCDLVLGPEEPGVMGLVVDVARRAAEERIEK